MKNFLRLGQNIDTMPILHALAMHPELWNRDKFRTTFERSPFKEVDDIYIRFSAKDRLAAMKCTEEFYSDTDLVFYPAAEILPVQKIIGDIMHRVGGYELMRTLVTRLKPGGRMLPHADTEGTYVQEGNIARYHVVLQGLPGSLFRCGDETVNMLTGEVWWFNALLEHEVVNNSKDDRIHLLVDCRLWP